MTGTLAFFAVLALMALAAAAPFVGLSYFLSLFTGAPDHVDTPSWTERRAEAKRLRKQHIFEEMQRAKRAGVKYRLPRDWAD